jgi:hypothetical protein
VTLEAWTALAGLGAFHGLNPGMGWLFAVALGLQERDRGAVLRAIPPIAAGHAAAVVVALAAFEGLRSVASPRAVAIGSGGVLVAFGLYKLVRRRHPRWVGMRVNRWELTWWSFLMASAHGAGLMLVPVLLAAAPANAGHPVTGLAAAMVVDASSTTLGAVAVHSAAMLAMTAGAAILVYDHLGVAVLRHAWINLDVIWAVALVAAGVFALFV